MPTVTEIMAQVLKLPRSDRGYLAQKIIESLDAEGDLPDAEKEMLDRRSRQLKDGTVTGITFDQLQEKLRSSNV